MRKAITLLLFQVICLLAGAQTNRIYDPYSITKKNAIKINLLSPFLATLNVSYEHLLSNRWSVQPGINYTHAILDASDRKYTSVNGFQSILDLRRYNKKTKWNGWYQQYFIRYTQIDQEGYQQDSSTQNVVINYQEEMAGISLGYVMGYQRTYQNRFVLDVFFGLNLSMPTHYQHSLSEQEREQYQVTSFEVNPYTNGAGLRVGLKAGYLF